MRTLNIQIEVPDGNEKYIGTKTEKNLWLAYILESMARNKYSYYASNAKKAGYEQFSEFYQRTADNEKEHAKIWFKELCQIHTVHDNLTAAVIGEQNEWQVIYKNMAETAAQEGFDDLAKLFEGVAAIEKRHAKRFSCLLDTLEQDSVFKKEELTLWECRNCGNVVLATEAPERCPVCDHPQSYYQVITKCDI